MNITNDHITDANKAVGVICRTLARRSLAPLFLDFVLTSNEDRVWLIAILDVERLTKLEPYEGAAHHISTALKGKPVVISNHTGLRYAVLLNNSPLLPPSVDYPGWQRGKVRLGMGMTGEIAPDWEEVG